MRNLLWFTAGFLAAAIVLQMGDIKTAAQQLVIVAGFNGTAITPLTLDASGNVIVDGN
jgi:hypothetical protein